MAETVVTPNTSADGHRNLPIVPEDVTSPDGTRPFNVGDGWLTPSTVPNRADVTPHSQKMEESTNTLVAKGLPSPSFSAASENEPPHTVRPSSTATTATITSGAASISGKSVECPGCKKVIDQSSGGVVVAFG